MESSVGDKRSLARRASWLHDDSVGPPRQTDEEQAGKTTLGDLLYADKTRTRVAEKDWLRLVESIARGISSHYVSCSNERTVSYLH